MQYFGHIKRHNNLQKELLEGKVEGKRAVGKQRLMWHNNIKEWTTDSMKNCTRAANDRDQWQIIARQPLKMR